MNSKFSCTFGDEMDGSARQHIPSFLLYGEQAGGGEAPFIHIETIAARSRALDWEIGAHRHDALAHVLLVRSGGGRFGLDGALRRFAAGAVLTVPSKLVHGFSFLPETDGLVLTLSDSLLGLARDMLVETELAGDPAGAMLVDLAADPGRLALLEQVMGRIQDELADPQVGQLSAIRSHVALILVTLARCRRFHGDAAAYSSQDLQLVERLRRRIGQSLAAAPGVALLAAELGVSAARLNAACRRVAGCSTLRLLHAARLVEAKRSLLYTERSISEIAYSLGFEDPAYFSRFFTQRTGRTPSAFRARQIPAG
jgi:AraC family transcriptional activator of pobA